MTFAGRLIRFGGGGGGINPESEDRLVIACDVGIDAISATFIDFD